MLLELWKTWFCDHFPGQLFQWLTTVWVKKVYLVSYLNFLWHSFTAFLLVLSGFIREKRSEPPPPLSALQSVMKSSLSLFFFKQNKTRDLSCLPSRQWHFLFDDFVSFSVLLWKWTNCSCPFRNVERVNIFIIKVFLWWLKCKVILQECDSCFVKYGGDNRLQFLHLVKLAYQFMLT